MFTCQRKYKHFLLLMIINVSEKNERLASATCPTVTHKNLKLTIKRIFVNLAASANKNIPSIFR